MNKTQASEGEEAEGTGNKYQRRPKGFARLVEGIFSRDGISQIYFFIVVSLLLNMGIGLYYCGRNMKKHDFLPNAIFESDSKVNGKDWHSKRMSIVSKEPSLSQTLNRVEIYGNNSNMENGRGIERPKQASKLIQPAVNLIPTCLYSKKFPGNMNLDQLLFWNASSDRYIYWSYQNKTNSFLILTHWDQIPHSSPNDTLLPPPFLREDQPVILSYQNHPKWEKEDTEDGGNKILAFGEKSLPPYWYMNWKDSSDKDKSFKPLFLPCLGSLYTYRDRDLVSFFKTRNVIFACGFKVYVKTESKTTQKEHPAKRETSNGFLEVDNAPFITMDKDYYTSLISGSKNTIHRLHINKCNTEDPFGEITWVMSYSNGVETPKHFSPCENRSSWISFSHNSALVSLNNIESGDWKSRIENDKFLPSKGIMKNTTCYTNWWTAYGGVPSGQFVPST